MSAFGDTVYAYSSFVGKSPSYCLRHSLHFSYLHYNRLIMCLIFRFGAIYTIWGTNFERGSKRGRASDAIAS